MNFYKRVIIEKAGHDHGFEVPLSSSDSTVVLASARHKAQATVRVLDNGFEVEFAAPLKSLTQELARDFPSALNHAAVFPAETEARLGRLLRRAAILARTLPNQAVSGFDQAVEQELAQLPAGIVNTQIERMVRLRVGQQRYREAMLGYWGNACAVTGLALPQVLRASHAKPWADCESDLQRLDVFNGFLLTPNLDALFDKFLISFDPQGNLLTAKHLTTDHQSQLGCHTGLKLRWIAPEHQPYLNYHRSRMGESEKEN